MLGQIRHEIGGMDMDEVQTELNGATVSANNADGVGSGTNQLRGWNPSSRIIRVSRASGGKDRHSKVWTSKGLRDRRVRLSVSTAIQFYDLQDRLGYDQPSKAVEWLIKAAADSISELPSINTAFPDTPNSNGGNENQQMDLGIGQNSQSQALSLSKSACSSTSDTSKNSSGLSLSRSEIRGSNRAKARERAKERATKEKENAAQQNSSSSFTQLLTGNFTDGASPAGYLSHQGYNGQFQLGSSNFPHHHHQTTMSTVPPFSITGENQNHHHQNHQEALHQFSFVPESLFHPAGSAGEYGTLNFSISGYNRGTLQSNSPSLFPNTVQKIPSSSTTMEGSNIPFFIGSTAGSPFENHHNHNHHQHHQFMTGPDGSLQLYYGDGSSDHKDKGKN